MSTKFILVWHYREQQKICCLGRDLNSNLRVSRQLLFQQGLVPIYCRNRNPAWDSKFQGLNFSICNLQMWIFFFQWMCNRPFCSLFCDSARYRYWICKLLYSNYNFVSKGWLKWRKWLQISYVMNFNWIILIVLLKGANLLSSPIS